VSLGIAYLDGGNSAAKSDYKQFHSGSPTFSYRCFAPPIREHDAIGVAGGTRNWALLQRSEVWPDRGAKEGSAASDEVPVRSVVEAHAFSDYLNLLKCLDVFSDVSREAVRCIHGSITTPARRLSAQSGRR